ncbi:Transcriptional repressor NF-X1 [Eumeta japonica]|uniref:Transcriptional repressor NF-X1 n=1 Tax=Eumeta variegata TaxID=151549 RepID=A0A4C1UW78_EUMVA|nr:Transcriptional repressor NF-X1 [Eumeta japonica]
MSDWSNGYEHNSSHYTNPSTWSNDSNSQFPSQSANYYNSSSEYINFDEFLSQMQGGANPQINSTHYNNVPYQNYSLNQYSQMPTSSQNLNQNTFMYGPGTSADRYGSLLSTRTSEDQYRGLNNPNSTYVSNRYPNSTLTPTATEFVPKMSQHSPLGSDSRAYVCSESNEVHTENDDYRINTGRNSQTNHGESSDKQSWKPNSRTNGKDGFVFYNSSLNKVNQDMKNGGKAAANYSNKQKSWAGTQRLRAMDRNNVDDERFANNYVQYKEEHQEVSTNKSRETSSPKASHNKIQISSEYSDNKEMTQRERLSEQLDKGTLECLVCCERVKQMETVWSCSNCYHVLHLRCIRKWAISSMQAFHKNESAGQLGHVPSNGTGENQKGLCQKVNGVVRHARTLAEMCRQNIGVCAAPCVRQNGSAVWRARTRAVAPAPASDRVPTLVLYSATQDLAHLVMLLSAKNVDVGQKHVQYSVANAFVLLPKVVRWSVTLIPVDSETGPVEMCVVEYWRAELMFVVTSAIHHPVNPAKCFQRQSIHVLVAR